MAYGWSSQAWTLGYCYPWHYWWLWQGGAYIEFLIALKLHLSLWSQVTGMKASTSNTTQTVLSLFLKIISAFRCPSQVCGDWGSENVDVCTWMIMYWGPNHASFMWGTWVIYYLLSCDTQTFMVGLEGLPTTLALNDSGWKGAVTLPKAGGHFLCTLKSSISLTTAIPITSSCSIPSLSLSWLSGTTIAWLFLYFAKSNSSFTLVDLIFSSYLTYSRDPYLILPIYLHVHSHTFLIFSSNALIIVMTLSRNREDNYLLIRRRMIFLSQLKGNLSAH